MDLKLNIYKNKKIDKTYITDSYDIMFGTLEDIIDVIDIDNIDLDNSKSLVMLTSKLIVSSMDTIKPLIKDIFDGLTDDELRNTKITELAEVLINVVKHTVKIMGDKASGKN